MVAVIFVVSAGVRCVWEARVGYSRRAWEVRGSPFQEIKCWIPEDVRYAFL